MGHPASVADPQAAVDRRDSVTASVAAEPGAAATADQRDWGIASASVAASAAADAEADAAAVATGHNVSAIVSVAAAAPADADAAAEVDADCAGAAVAIEARRDPEFNRKCDAQSINANCVSVGR